MWTKWLSTSLVIMLVMSLASPAIGQDPAPTESTESVVSSYTVYRLPKGFRWSEDGAEDENGNPVVNTYQCYDLADYKQLLLIDNDLRGADQTIQNLTGVVTDLKAATTDLQSALKAEEAASGILRVDRDTWFEEWKKENKARHIAENKPTFSTLPWIIAITSSAALLGFITAAAL